MAANGKLGAPRLASARDNVHGHGRQRPHSRENWIRNDTACRWRVRLSIELGKLHDSVIVSALGLRFQQLPVPQRLNLSSALLIAESNLERQHYIRLKDVC